jgi:hypothetical protein
VAKVVRCWPEPIQAPVLQLRALIFATAKRIDKLPVDETLKWGEPAYSTHKGSTIRLGWSDKSPEHYRLHFICTSKLGDAYRELYGDILTIEARRALVFHQSDVLPADAVSSCIALAMRYHEIKHLPNLGC